MSNQPPFSAATYQSRRDALRTKVGSGQILLLGNQEASKNFKDNWYHFRQDSTFLYYFGIDLPDLMAVIDCDSGRDYIIGDDLTIDHVVWTGPQPTVAELAAQVGVHNTLTTNTVGALLVGKVHYIPPYRGEQTIQLYNILGAEVNNIAAGVSMPLIHAIIAQRNIKTAEEITEMHKACTITSRMHHAVMAAARPGMYEYELVGVAHRVAAEHNVHFSFPPILTKNGQTLHNHYHGHQLLEGDIVLYDGGGESLSYYAGDMTRTFPVGRTYSTKQKEIYEVVYQMHRSSIAALAPGKTYQSIHLDAARVMVDGLKALGLMKGNTDDAVTSGAYAMFFPHGLGHMIGLDVHDMENLGEQHVGYGDGVERSTMFGLRSLRLGQRLESGNCITVEPGIYFIPELMDMWRGEGKYMDYLNYDKMEDYKDFGGIRLEEDFVITDKGSELLGEPVASSIGEIEGVRAY